MAPDDYFGEAIPLFAGIIIQFRHLGEAGFAPDVGHFGLGFTRIYAGTKT